MSITREPLSKSVCIISVSGRLDHTQSNELQATLESAIKDGYLHLVVDMSAVTYINSSGLRSLVSGWRKAASHNGKLVLCGLEARIQQVFGTVGFDKIFEVFSTRVDAVNHLSNA